MVPLCDMCFINVMLLMFGNSCPEIYKSNLATRAINSGHAVSYTHLDVYKRQVCVRVYFLLSHNNYWLNIVLQLNV